MTKVLVKAYLPTLDEKRGVSLDDIESLRWIPSRRKKTFSKPVPVSRSTKRGVGQTVPWELDVLENKGKPLPGLLDPNKPGQINPKVDISGTWVGPSNVHTLANPDYAFGPSDQATLLGITETPHWYRSGDEGAKTYAGEGFQYGGFDKDAFVEIPLPKYAHPKSIGQAAFNSFAPPFYQRELPQEMMDFVNQFPHPKGSETLDAWQQKVGAPLNLQQLIDQGHLMPLSENQKILDSPFIQNGEPMDIAFQLLKEELSRVSSSPTLRRQPRVHTPTQNPANLPCSMCDGRILQQPCQKCGRPASLGAGTLKSDISKNLNRWFKEKWVDVSRKNKDGKHPPCGRSKAKKSSKGYPKCRPSVKVSSKTPKTSGSMSEGQKQAATKRKRAKKQGVGGKPTIVKSFVKVI
mgnify:CR=1 FL=1